MKSKEFQQLIELVDLVNKYKVRKIEIISNPGSTVGEESRYWDFYEGISAGKLNSDKEAAQHLGLDNSERKFKRLRKGLIKRLINTIFFIDVSDTTINTLYSIHYEYTKQYAALKILHSRGARNTTFEMAKSLLSKSRKYEFCEITAGAAQILLNYYSKVPGGKQKFDECRILALENAEKRKNEILIQGYYFEILMPFVNSKSTKKAIKEKVDTALKTVSDIPEKFRSRIFQLYIYRLRVSGEMIVNNWVTTIEECNSAIQYFENKGLKKEKRTFYLQKSIAEIMLRKYPEAEKSTDECLALTPYGSGNWFKLQEIKMLLFFHSKRYQEAFSLIQSILKNQRIDSISSADRETWRLFDAYLHLLISIRKISESNSKAKKFRLSKFMNEVPLFSKDKRGMNIPIIILHFIFLIKEGKFDEASFRIEAIMKYYQRHLKSEHENYRTNCFLKMLECISKSGFEVNRTIKKAIRFKENLESTSINILDQAHEIEIIPYENLWQICLDCLQEGNKNFR